MFASNSKAKCEWPGAAVAVVLLTSGCGTDPAQQTTAPLVTDSAATQTAGHPSGPSSAATSPSASGPATASGASAGDTAPGVSNAPSAGTPSEATTTVAPSVTGKDSTPETQLPADSLTPVASGGAPEVPSGAGGGGAEPPLPPGGAGGTSPADDAGATPVTPDIPRSCDGKQTLREAAECTSRLAGTAIPASLLSNTTFTDIAAREFNYVTPENEMKWGNIEPSRDSFSFGSADQIVAFAEQNGMKVKGHTLVWHNQLPGWMQNLNSAEDVRAAMLNHINKVMEHYKGKVIAWDVVNEAWANPNDWPNLDTPTLRDSVFMRTLGEGFIDEAFVAARAADPDAKLYYNDFRSEAVGQPKGDAIFEMIKGMVERGVPIDGVGLQTHLGLPNDKPPIEDIIANMQRLADLGLEVLISEMDDHVCDGETAEEQGVRFHDIVAACVAQPACPAVTVWGISDGGSWLNGWDELNCAGRRPAGLLWDDNYQTKPGYDGVLDAFNGQ